MLVFVAYNESLEMTQCLLSSEARHDIIDFAVNTRRIPRILDYRRSFNWLILTAIACRFAVPRIAMRLATPEFDGIMNENIEASFDSVALRNSPLLTVAWN